MTPFGLAFDWLDTHEGHQIFFFNDTWNALDSIIDIIFMLEIIICFNTSYYYERDDHKEAQIKSSKNKIKKSKKAGANAVVPE